jgi:hypothetical protein
MQRRLRVWGFIDPLCSSHGFREWVGTFNDGRLDALPSSVHVCKRSRDFVGSADFRNNPRGERHSPPKCRLTVSVWQIDPTVLAFRDTVHLGTVLARQR